MSTAAATTPRYEALLRLASGGMATVWIGTVRGALGFRQLVAIKKPHPHLLSDPGFRGELVAEARLASMIRHANVVDVRDVEIDGESISLIMDFIEGASLGELLVASSRQTPPASNRIPARVAVRIVRDACAGLHAAHELVDERNRPVGLVHRDVSPQNVLVGTDGIARVTDFGVAKFSRKNMQSTSEGSLKGKLAYMAPEYVRGEAIDRRFDVFALGVVLWEALTGKRCFRAENEAETLRRLLEWVPDPVSSFARELEPLDSVIACALAKDREDRFQNAAAMGAALEGAATSAGLMGTHTEVASVLKDLVGNAIEERRTLVRAKLANEPSVASLMGHPPIEALALAPAILNAPPNIATLVDEPRTRALSFAGAAPLPLPVPSVDAGGGGGGAGGATITTTANADTPKMGGGNPAGAVSAVPSTQPMTPQHAVVGGASAATTLESPMMMPAAPPQSPQTLASAPMMMMPSYQAAPPQHSTLRSEEPSDGRGSGNHGVGAANPMHYASSDALTSAFPVSPPPRRSLVPFFIGTIVVVAAVGALIWFAGSKQFADTTSTSTASTTTASSFIASASPPPALSVAPLTSVAPLPPASATPTTTTTTHTAAAHATHIAPTHPTPTALPPPAPAPTPTPTPTSTIKKPPDNPYNN